MTQIKKLNITYEDMLSYFDNLTEKTLEHYDHLIHDGSILDIMNAYLFVIDHCIAESKYQITPKNSVPSGSKHITSSHYEQIDGVKTTVGEYSRFRGLIKRPVYPQEIPPQVRRCLKEEREILIDVLLSFKTINWAIDRKLKGERSRASPLKKPYQHYIKEAYNALVKLSEFHRSDCVKPFVMGGPNHPSIDDSNRIRNKFLYDVVNRLFKGQRIRGF